MNVLRRQTRFRLCFPRFMRTRRKVEASAVVQGDGRPAPSSAARFGDEGEVVSHLGSLNRSTLCVSAKTSEGLSHDRVSLSDERSLRIPEIYP